MFFKVIATGSKGNCYLLGNNEETLLIECGVNVSELGKAINYDFDKVKCCLVTHEHNDHAKYCKQLSDRWHTSFAMTKGTNSKVDLKSNLCLLELNKTYTFGNFKVIAFATKHDAVEPCGYLIKHIDMGVMLFMTDTDYITTKFKGVTHIAIECDYDDVLIYSNFVLGKIDNNRYLRTTANHMSIANVNTFLNSNVDISKVKDIILIHNSRENLNKTIAKEQVANSIMAERGLTIELK